MTCNQSVAGANLQKQFEIKELIKLLGLQAVIFGDFNEIPEVVLATTWAKQLKLVLKKPIDVDASCTNGGRLLDYALATASIAPAVDVWPIYGAPFGTHLGLRIDVNRAPRTILANHVIHVSKP